ncbi:MAG: hypothetical protein R3Y64_09615 [Peptostreptococcaceae bacterium]
MKSKINLILIFCILILFVGFRVYHNNSKNFKIINETEENISISILVDNNDNTEKISIDKFSTKTIELPTDADVVTILYYYDNNKSAESFEIFNKEINVKYSKMIINSIDNHKKIFPIFK